MAAEFTETFLRDADDILAAMRGDSVPVGSDDEGAHLARALHSLKSGASFLGWDRLEQEAHELENLLEDPSSAELDWLAAADRLEELIESHKPVGRHSRGRSHGTNAIRFTDLERRVLEESRLRGERFYRLACLVDPSEPLPYPRAFLISSRLETGMTLVKSDPPMDDSEADFSRPVFWFTSDETEQAIHAVADVDLVTVLELARIDYQDALEAEEMPVDAGSGARDIGTEDATLVVDRSRYAEAMEIAEELAWRLDGKPGLPESTLSGELQRTLETLAYRPLEPMLGGIGEAVDRLADRRGIKARFRWTIASGGLDAATLETLAEILRQLVRNSLRHGIETPEERRLAGKDERGEMILSMDRSGRSYRFRFEDDGRGIDEAFVRNLAKQGGLPQAAAEVSEAHLLDILCAPGFSTAAEADTDGGRGLGLEMIRHLLTREFDSDLELENRPGRGLVLSWSLPEKHMRRPYLVFVSEGSSWAIPADAVRRRGVMDPGKVSAAGQAYDIGGGLIPMVGPLGLLPPGTVSPYVLEIHHRGRRAALLVDDLVSEEPWGADDLVPADLRSPWCRSLKDSRDGIPILSPAIVYAADAPRD